MWAHYIKSFLTNFLIHGLVVAFFAWWLIFIPEITWVWISIAILLTLTASYKASQDVNSHLKNQYQEQLRQKEQAQKDSDLWKQSLIEKSTGFPTLLNAIAEYETLRDKSVETFLRHKKHPSIKGAEVVKEEARRRREAEYECKKTRAIIDYYESIAPFLLDFKDDITSVDDEERYREYDEQERIDPATHYLAKEEFRQLPTVQRNQLALDRFWTRPKSKWLLGRLYERYIGYLYEKESYDVDYVGIIKGYEDLGRDLICRKADDFIIIQCKNWSQFKTIYEKHIFQFFGTVFQYKDANPQHRVRAIFYTTTKLSDLAHRFADELGIEMREKFAFDKGYPSIKCNVSRIDGTKIYHLPFDQQYDRVKIEKNRGEFYCATVKEAEGKRFRRAFRYKGTTK